MNESDFGELVVRMVLSLGLVLVVIGLAYLILRRRTGSLIAAMSARGRSFTPSRRGGPNRPERGRPRPSGRRIALRQLGRLGVGRTSNVVVLQFADDVFLIGASDGTAPVVLASTSLDTWAAAAEREGACDIRAVPMSIDPAHQHPGPAPRVSDRCADGRGRDDGGHQVDSAAASLSLIEALRDATARRA